MIGSLALWVSGSESGLHVRPRSSLEEQKGSGSVEWHVETSSLRDLVYLLLF